MSTYYQGTCSRETSRGNECSDCGRSVFTNWTRGSSPANCSAESSQSTTCHEQICSKEPA